MSENLRNPTEVVLGLLFLSITGLTFYLMADFPSGNRYQGMGPAFYPSLLAALLGLLSLTLAIRGWIGVKEESSDEDNENDEYIKETLPLIGSHLKIPGVLILIVCTYLIAMNALGFLITSPIFLVATMKSLRSGWKTSLIIGVLLTALIYGVFGVALRVPLPEGYLVSG